MYRPNNLKNTYLQMFMLIREKIKCIIYTKNLIFFPCRHSIDRDIILICEKKNNYKSCVNFILNNTATN